MPDNGLPRLLEQMREGYELQDAEFSAFSDLDRGDAQAVDGAWPALPLATRALLLERAAELADVNVDFNFAALGRIGLRDPDSEVRERAVGTLWEAEDRDTGERLAQAAAGDSAASVRAAAALALQPFVERLAMGRLDPALAERIIAALEKASGEDDVSVRAAALEAAGAIPRDWVADRIIEGYESGERELQVAALRAMGASALERWVEYIGDQLYSGEPEMRLEAVMAAGNLGSDALVDQLGEVLSDEDPEVVLGAVEALGEIGGEEATDLLRAFGEEAPEGFHEAVAAALEAAAETGMFRRFGEIETGEDEE